MSFKVGTDPEVFTRDSAGNLASAFGLIPGTKDKPYPVVDGAVQVDGMALEFNTDPAEDSEEFLAKVKSVMGQLESMIGSRKIDITPVAEFGSAYISAQPTKAKELGCDPDYNAYTELENPAPDVNSDFRTAAGHIHIGWCEGVDPQHPDHFKACALLAKELDYFLGLPSLLWDDCYKRRELYGKAGAFRAKPYGMEYRTLSNAWLQSDELIKWVGNTALIAAKFLASGHSYAKVYGKSAQIIIDECTGPLSVHRRKYIENMCSKSGIGFPPGFESHTDLEALMEG